MRTKGAKDLRPRKKRQVISFAEFKASKQQMLEEGIDFIVKKALQKGLHADLWEILNCFRKIKNI